MNCRPGGLQFVGQPARITKQHRAARLRINKGEKTLPRLPRARYGMRAHVIDHLRIDTLRRTAQCHFTQCRQIAGREKIMCSTPGGIREIDLAFLQPLQKIIRRDVDKLHIVGMIQNGVWHSLPHAHMGNLRNDIVQAFQMLNIQRRVDINTVIKQLLHIEIALRMAAARHIGVGQLIDQGQCRLSLQDGIEIHFRQHAPLVEHALLRNDLETPGQHIGLDAAVGFHHTNDDIARIHPALARLAQHFIGFADARRGTQKYLEPAALFPSRLFQQGVGRRTGGLIGHTAVIAQAWPPASHPVPDSAEAHSHAAHQSRPERAVWCCGGRAGARPLRGARAPSPPALPGNRRPPG